MRTPRTSALTGQRVLVYSGGSSWDAPPGTDRHLATHLAERLPVVYVDPPDSVLWQARHGRRPTLRAGFAQVGEQLYRLTPRALPGVTRPGLREVAHAGCRRAIRQLVEELRLDVAAHVVASLDDLFDATTTDCRVLYGTDDFMAGAELMGISRTWVARREPRAIAAATHVLAVSDVIAERWRGFGRDVTVLPNGCDTDAFAATPDRSVASEVSIPEPRAIVVGQLSVRLDLALLEGVVQTGRSLLLVGPAVDAETERRLSELTRHPHVQWVGRQPFEALPGFLRAAVVGLTPYVDDEFNRASFPLKTLEYLAAGLPVVSSDLPAARALATDHVTVAGDHDAFVAATLRLLETPWSPEQARIRQAFAALHSWSSRADELLRTVGITVGG
jgi:teichuronic acid biosynthesis glycosyltransferase TuaH